jgi:hypothetical protein
MKMAKYNIDTIEEGQGLGNLKFGLTRNEVESIIGEPEEKENFSFTEDEENLTESWHYDELELSLGFDQEDDWRLVTISISSENYKFRDFCPVGLSKKELKTILEEKGIDDLEFEDLSTIENPSHGLISSESLGLNFWFDDDSLNEVQWGPLFIDNETVKWPK